MARPRCTTQLALTSAHNADRAVGIPPNHWCYRFFESIYCSFTNAQFAHLYQDGGRAPISPTLLACITILQYAFKVSDRMAVESTIMRRDWRIALGRDDSWAGFDASVLCNFRKRLIEHGCEEMIFGHVLEQLRSLGLLANRRKVRVDATSLVAASQASPSGTRPTAKRCWSRRRTLPTRSAGMPPSARMASACSCPG